MKNTNKKIALLFFSFALVALFGNDTYSTVVVPTPGNAEKCSGGSYLYRPDIFYVCQTDNEWASEGYLYSRWFYYRVDVSQLPEDNNGNKYIPPIGPANGGNGSAKDGNYHNWLPIDDSTSNCIKNAGGFYRRGYIQYKGSADGDGNLTTPISVDETDDSEKDYYEDSSKGRGSINLGASQLGFGPIGFTGRSSNTYGAHGDLLSELPSDFSISNYNNSQMLYWKAPGSSTRHVFAWIDYSKDILDDSEAQTKAASYSASGITNLRISSKYFLGKNDEADVLFCYADSTNYNGSVGIGNNSTNSASRSKIWNSSAASYNVSDNPTAYDFGEVSSSVFTPSYLNVRVWKADSTRTNETSYVTQITNTATGVTYEYDGSSWKNDSEVTTANTTGGVTISSSPSFTLKEGVNTICVTLDYKERSTSDSGYGTPKLEACAKVKYVPLVATIQSKTKVTASTDAGVTTSESSVDNGDGGTNGSSDAGEVLNVAYGKNVSISWDHALGVSGVKKSTGETVSPMAGSFNVRISNLSYDLNSSKTIKTLSSGSYNTGLNDWNISGAGTNLVKSDNSTVKFNDSELVKLLPGDSRTINKGIVHPETVKNDTSSTISGSKKSSRKVTINANNVKCNINGKEIGVNNADNYAKMSLSVSESYKSRTVGDGVDDSGDPYPSSSTVWLKGNDKIKKFSYSICDGAQIAKDRAWLDNNSSVTDWTSASVTDLDKFEISMNPLNNSLNGRLYNTNSNGRTPATSIQLFGVDGKNIRADEIGDNKYLQARVDAGYQLEDQDTVAATEASYQLGQTIEHSISFQTSNNDTTVKKYSITTKVPYNYIMDPGFDQFDGSSIYYGEDISAVSNVKTNGRVNEDTGATAADAPTLTKTSKYYTAIFTLDADKKHDDLLNGISASGATRMKDSFGNETRDFYIQSDDEFENIVNNQIGGTVVARTTEKDGTATTKVGEGVAVSVGTKYCAVTAVWPADSHNDMNVTGDSVIASGSPQTNALIGDNPGTGAYWRFEISCRTLGKKPTVSVEGSGIVSGGGVIASTTNYGGNIFGSWSEYGLIADNSTSVNFGTGASLAYHGPQFFVNEQADPSEAGLNKDAKCIGIETVGNINCINQVGLDPGEAYSYASRAYSVKNQIVGKNGTTKHNGNLIIYSNVSKNADGSTPIIYADNIKIHPDVTEINAILIADDNLDTCYLEDKQNETTQGGTKGNSGLKDLCGKQLVVNGAVFAENITLDRTFGGGSYGDSVMPRSLVQRAEIFNFDSAYVSEVYKQSMEEDPITTTYIKELPSRY